MTMFGDCPEARSYVAKQGWITRRNGPTLRQRFGALDHRVADGPARLYCCDLAERIALPAYQAAFPDDPRPTLILWVARQYARGEASERERLGLRQVAIAMVEALDPAGRLPRTPAGTALQAIAWCIDKPTSSMIWSTERWCRDVLDEPGQAALLAELVAAMETMPQKPRREVPTQRKAS